MGPDKFVAFLYAPPAGAAPPPGQQPAPLILFSGEWGFTPLHQDTASDLAAKGRYVLGIDSSEYFKKMIPSESYAGDLALFRSTVNEAASLPRDAPVILAGFSWGAAMVPYLVNRAGPQGILGALLLAPPRAGAAVFRVAIKLKLAIPEEETFDVGEEMRRMPPLPVVLMQGTKDDQAQSEALLPYLRGMKLYAPIAGGDHQFHEARDVYFDQVARALRWIETQPRARGGASPAPPAAPSGGPAPGPAPTPAPAPGPTPH